MVKLPCGTLRNGRPQAKLRLSDIDRPFGENAVRHIIGWKKKRSRGQRVLGASGARAGGRVLAASGTFDTLSFENDI